ncbi:MAG: hypothetical protein ACXAEF_01695 [Candidatus Thorarchaeota archaeon]|jgi:hypothetical protein
MSIGVHAHTGPIWDNNETKELDHTMNPTENGGDPFAIWCPLIPLSKLKPLAHHFVELERVNGRYDDWRASMRSKKIVGVHVGVLLDRVRILLMGIGIACASNRNLADNLHAIISDCLRKSCLEALEKVKAGKDPEVVSVISKFFDSLRFTRDIYPEEEVEKAAMSIGINLSSQNQTIALDISATIVKAVYIRLLSPDPWQFTSGCD